MVVIEHSCGCAYLQISFDLITPNPNMTPYKQKDYSCLKTQDTRTHSSAPNIWLAGRHTN